MSQVYILAVQKSAKIRVKTPSEEVTNDQSN